MNIEITQENLISGCITKRENGITYVACPKSGLDCQIYNRDLTENPKYLVIETEILNKNCLCYQLAFYEKGMDKPTIRVIFGLLPNMMITVPIDLSILDSQNLFPERTLGRLKMVVFGKPLDFSDVERIHLQTLPYFEDFNLAFKSIYTCSELPKYDIPNVKLVDEMGQWLPKEWDTKMKNREQCNKHLNDLAKEADEFNFVYPNSNWDEFGGDKSLSFKATGFFRTEYALNHWWLVDPIGNSFLSLGLDCIHIGEGTRIDMVKPWISEIRTDGIFKNSIQTYKRKNKEMSFCNYGVLNLMEAFGENFFEKWAKITKMYLYKWGVNTIGNWSDLSFIKYAKMPYVIPIDNFSKVGFPKTNKNIFRDFPDVYSKEYAENSEIFGEALDAFKDDKYLIGYFMRNEPEWAFVNDLNIAEEMMATDVDFDSKITFIDELKKKYNNIEDLNKAWLTSFASFDDLLKPIKKLSEYSDASRLDTIEFSKKMIAKYISIPSAALKRHDSNHMNLGVRYATISSPLLLCGSENFDVFSINSYKMSPLSNIKEIESLKMPIMIGEFHHGALDKGLTAHGLRAVRTQADRGKAYRYYVEQGLTNKYLVGTHYFLYNDQSCVGRFDGENYQIGLIDVCMQEYIEMTKGMIECHKVAYGVAKKEIEAFDDIPEEIPAIHY